MFHVICIIILGYGPFKGQILGAGDLGELYEGLQENRLNENYTHLLTGLLLLLACRGVGGEGGRSTFNCRILKNSILNVLE